VRINVLPDPETLGKEAAFLVAQKLSAAIEREGSARIVLSTGASQFETIKALINSDVDWKRVTLFHLDEYIGMPESHKASFRRYLKERFISKVDIGRTVLIDGETDIQAHIEYLNREIEEKPIDIGVIGVGTNAHIAFNDPPADFDVKTSFIVVKLDEKCKLQQVNEGWFDSIEMVPEKAITMSPYRIMQCKTIVSPVPYIVKAEAISAMLGSKTVTNEIPATILKTHPDITLFLDNESASLCDSDLIKAHT